MRGGLHGVQTHYSHLDDTVAQVLQRQRKVKETDKGKGWEGRDIEALEIWWVRKKRMQKLSEKKICECDAVQSLVRDETDVEAEIKE